MKEIYTSCYSIQDVIHILSFRKVNLLCCGSHFDDITFIDAKTKYRSPYLLEGFQPYLQNHLGAPLGRSQDVFEGHPQDIGRTHPLEVNIRTYGDVLIMSAEDVLKTLVGYAPWHYIQDSMRTSPGRYTGTSLGRHISTSYGRRQRTSSGHRQETSLGVTQQTIGGYPGTSFGDVLGTQFCRLVVCKLRYLQFGFQKNRSSHSQMYFIIGVLKNFAMLTGKHLCWSIF